MSSPARTRPVEDTIPKIENELAIGEDLEFQRRWWRFEHVVWICFTIILALDIAGVFGRGPLSKAHAKTSDGAIHMTYERFARFQTPSLISLHLSPAAVRNGHIQLWVSQSIIKPLGNQRIIPQPATSELAQDGVLYTWPSGVRPDSVDFAIEPSTAGVEHFTVRLPELGDQLTERVIVYP